MTVACRIVDCPLNDNQFCCDNSILIGRDGRCYNLIKGFTPEDEKKLKEISKIDIEDVVFDENTDG